MKRFAIQILSLMEGRPLCRPAHAKVPHRSSVRTTQRSSLHQIIQTAGLVLFLFAACARASDTTDFLRTDKAKELIGKKCIRLGTSEVLDLNFDTACTVLENPNLLEAVQAEFVQSISTNGKVDFEVIQTSPTTCYYINEHGRRADIIEHYRQKTDAHSFNYVMQASGKRFFGSYDVIIHLQIVDAGPAGLVYSVQIHAYPHNGITRFTVRRIGPAKKYFIKKMKLISYVAREIAVGLCAKEEFQIILKNDQSTGE